MAQKTQTYIDRIKALKTEKKIINEQLAEMTGIPLGTLSKILAGISDSPKLANIISIANALGCSVEYLINGTPENTNNYTLSAQEIRVMESYRRLDAHGKELTLLVINKEEERINREEDAVTEVTAAGARILPTVGTVNRHYEGVPGLSKRSIPLYDMPVSAGTGVDLSDENATRVRIPDTPKTEEADFALRISGNSMEPKFHNGDILLVQDCDSVEVGELGIFILDGAGYFKKYDGDRLLSLNPVYGPIPLSDFSSVQCAGRVIGKMYRK